MNENFQFTEENPMNNSINSNINMLSKEPKIVTLLIKSKIAKDTKQANIILLIFTIFAIIATILLLTSLADTQPNSIPYKNLSELEKSKLPLEERLFIEKNLNINNEK